MNASRLYPKEYKGQEESAGFISQNEKRKNEKSPHYRGRVYLEGAGWFWISGWLNETKIGEIISLKFTGLTDKEAAQYCAPRGNKRRDRPARDEPPDENDSSRDSDIPF